MPDKIKIYHERAKQHRTIHCDHFRIGLTTRGDVQISLMSETIDLDSYSEFRELTPEGKVGAEIEQPVEENVVGVVRREIESDVILSRRTASILSLAIRENLKLLEQNSSEESTDEDQS